MWGGLGSVLEGGPMTTNRKFDLRLSLYTVGRHGCPGSLTNQLRDARLKFTRGGRGGRKEVFAGRARCLSTLGSGTAVYMLSSCVFFSSRLLFGMGFGQFG